MRCPKCQTSLRKSFVKELYEIDVAHPGEPWEAAERRITDACSRALYHRHRGIKIIHGHGSVEGHSSVIRNRAIPHMRRLARKLGGKLVQDRGNPGAHIIYFN